MTETQPTLSTATCIRGCKRARLHLADCDDDQCRGCEPRRAEYGHLCWPCHRRLSLMLEQAETAERWLTGNLPGGMKAARSREDYERPGTDDGAPTPLSLEILDVRQLLRDRLTAWTDDLIEQHHLSGPDRHSVAADARYLLMWLDRCEAFDWIGDWIEELAETMRDAHALAPWRPEVGHLRGIPCPECHQARLVIYGGESEVCCQACRSMFSRARYGLWIEILATEHGVATMDA